jgi:hypothetical protein
MNASCWLHIADYTTQLGTNGFKFATISLSQTKSSALIAYLALQPYLNFNKGQHHETQNFCPVRYLNVILRGLSIK